MISEKLEKLTNSSVSLIWGFLYPAVSELQSWKGQTGSGLENPSSDCINSWQAGTRGIRKQLDTNLRTKKPTNLQLLIKPSHRPQSCPPQQRGQQGSHHPDTQVPAKFSTISYIIHQCSISYVAFLKHIHGPLYRGLRLLGIMRQVGNNTLLQQILSLTVRFWFPSPFLVTFGGIQGLYMHI